VLFRSDFELDSSKYKLTELWTKENYKLVGDKLTLNQKPHSVKIIAFEKL
jgi:hypothetical protein